MDSFEINKILGAILGTCLVLLVTSFTATALFAPAMPEKPGFEIAVKAAPEGGAKEAAPAPAEREAAADGSRREGRRGGQEMPGLPHLREGRSEPRRSEPLRDRRRSQGRGTRLQFLRGHEGQGRHLDRPGPQPVHR